MTSCACMQNHNHLTQPRNIPMKVPGSCPLTEPQERSAEPKVEEKNSAKEARGLRYAKAAEELGTAGVAVAWAASGRSPRTTREGDAENGMASSRPGATPFWAWWESPRKRIVVSMQRLLYCLSRVNQTAKSQLCSPIAERAHEGSSPR